ncbi:hypothetical protein COT48_01550 [Candidatus Woesearchaeota archaeon CG08_land_8_20_14_0_20_47_9]|nr:MAG: hypothetical protein AUJ69_04560 [Candidatus Woesearchaeota archaeon CG1_02_47_18]PIN75445.1 MAG: hypothetical protein COV22_00845 [Candidatus Woesearchaeota archaeon CG10_big_fil_rev_8_21_14_0_10_47_5]PIO04221.1 MAG: hypothetical protein COT48_01550 [Candidatus Woesearchaeota archaeon CG08_land_8_20_14_0_20_47_9]HII29804.1 hypothetical protein [Candidatus Woesearchaeota archaeon]
MMALEDILLKLSRNFDILIRGGLAYKLFVASSTLKNLYKTLEGYVNLSKADWATMANYYLSDLIGMYGIVELVCVISECRQDRLNGVHASFVRYLARLLRAAPIITPVMSYLAQGDFFLSVTIPVIASIAGYTFQICETDCFKTAAGRMVDACKNVFHC